MKIINASYEIMDPIIENARDYIYKKIERVGRICYKSENAITDDSAAKFVKNLVLRQHEAMLEHASMTVKFTVDRGVSHELVRHRMASFAQESTRYCNYSKDKFGGELTFIRPCFYDPTSQEYIDWTEFCKHAEDTYLEEIRCGATPEQARTVLPNSLKTEIVVTANMREWRHILSLRAAGTTGAPHPQMAEVMVPLLGELATYMPELFGDIAEICG